MIYELGKIGQIIDIVLFIYILPTQIRLHIGPIHVLKVARLSFYIYLYLFLYYFFNVFFNKN